MKVLSSLFSIVLLVNVNARLPSRVEKRTLGSTGGQYGGLPSCENDFNHETSIINGDTDQMILEFTLCTN